MPQFEVQPGTGLPAGMFPDNDPQPHPSMDPARWDPLVIEVTQLGGEPQVVDYLGPAVEVDRPINGLPTAKVPVVLYDGFLVNTGTEADPVSQPLVEVLPDDATVTIRTARPSPENDWYLFRGYPNLVTRSAQRGKDTTVDCVHLADDLDRDIDRFVHGQLWLKTSQEESYADSAQPSLIPKVDGGWPAVFNPQGAKNCRTKLLYLSDPEAGSREGWPAKFCVPLWAHQYDDNRQSFTWARVFMFLFYWGRRQADGTLGSLPHDLVDCNLWKIIYDNEYHLIDPDGLSGEPSSNWGKHLLGKPLQHGIEGMSWLAALKWTCHRSGISYCLDNWTDPASGEPREGFRFFVPGESRRTTVKLPSKHFQTDDKTPTEVRRKADVSNMVLVTNYGGCTNEALGAGSAKQYEVTVELVPGWDYVASRSPQVDVDPTDQPAVDAAIAQIDTSAWVNKYTTKGKQSRDDRNYMVLRQWIAPDFADLHESEKVRPHDPWIDEMYEPLDLNDLGIGEVEGQARRNSLRPRPIGRCLTGQQPGQTLPPIVQVSYRSGVADSWFELPAEPQVMQRRMGIFLTIDDLRDTSLMEVGAGASTDTFPQAYIRGTLRMRVTGVISGDTAADTEKKTLDAGSLSRRTRGRLLYRPDSFAYAIREDKPGGVGGGNSMFKGTDDPVTERFDTQDSWLVNKFLLRADRVPHSGPLVMPGLVFPWRDANGGVTYGFRPGDEVREIEAEAGQHAHDLALRSRADDNYAIIGNVNWSWSPGNGKDRPPRHETTLTLEDPGALVSFGK